jgi:hypothetical protein
LFFFHSCSFFYLFCITSISDSSFPLSLPLRPFLLTKRSI